jgi:dTDP-4-dehydrorhamnose reductase
MHFVDRGEIDLTLPEKINGALAGYEFDVLVNAAAYTAVDAAETDAETARIVNTDSVEKMARHCADRNALFIHISTDYVFDGLRPQPAREDDATSPIGVYGITKNAGEIAVRKYCANHIIMRTSWLYAAHGHNFLNTMLKLAKTRPELQVVFDQTGTPTCSADLAKAIESVILKYAASTTNFPAGTYHFANEGVASWYDFACAIFEISGSNTVVHPVDSQFFPTAAKRPAYSVLNKQKIKDTFGIEIKHWRQALRDCLIQRNTTHE